MFTKYRTIVGLSLIATVLVVGGLILIANSFAPGGFWGDVFVGASFIGLGACFWSYVIVLWSKS